MKNDQQLWPRVQLAMGEAVNRWIYDPNVMYIDFGWKERGGVLIKNKLCVRVHVIEKFTTETALEAAVQQNKTSGPIPDNIGGFDVDRPQGDYLLHQDWLGNSWRQTSTPRGVRAAPMQGGISISNYRNIYGTLGGSVMDRDTDEKMILSNWHVLAGSWQARPGWPIYQPGLGDGGNQMDRVANLSHHAMSSNLDAAVAKLDGNRKLINNQFGLSPVKGVSWAQLGMDVVKSGRRTGITYGRVVGVDGTARINYNGVYRLIQNVMTIVPRAGQEVSDGGDSGSFWLEEGSMKAVGLHFAGNNYPERALAMDMEPILDALNVDIDTAVT